MHGAVCGKQSGKADAAVSHGLTGKLQHVQQGNVNGLLQLAMIAMGCITGHYQAICAAVFQPASTFHHLGQGIRTTGQQGSGSVWDGGIIVDQDVDVFLITGGLRMQHDLAEQVCGSHGSHAADNTNGSSHDAFLLWKII